MDLTLSRKHRELQEKARAFTQEVLFPHEMECEENDGISQKTYALINQQVLDWGFNGINHAKEHGGQGMTVFEQMLVNEQLGMVTGALWDAVPQPAYSMRYGTPEQIETYLIPCCQNRRRDAYAITEFYAGSDSSLCLTSADACQGGYRISGEKLYVTVGDIADFLLVHTHVNGDPDKATLFFVDKNLPGVSIRREPKFTHNFAFGHPEIILKDVFVDESKILGEIGGGYDLTKDWFVESRLSIAARCVGAANRALSVANKFAAGRMMFGQCIRNFQAIEFTLADMAMDIMAVKSMLYRVCWEISESVSDRKLKHARASAVKLCCSEMVGRVCDKAVQIMGGRGYMRENPVERLWRDVRIDRIWEGTSEIQRQIIGGQIKKRGLDIYTGW